MVEEIPVDGARLDALLNAALMPHRDRLDDSRRAVVRQHAERLRRLATELEAYPLTNADEPDASFQALDRVDGP